MAIKLADQLRFSTPSPNSGGSGPMQQAKGGEKKKKKKKTEGEATTLRGEEGGAYDGVETSDLSSQWTGDSWGGGY